MAYITIKTNRDEDSMTLFERVLPSDLESEFFCRHLVERLRWAVADAHRAPRQRSLYGHNGSRPVPSEQIRDPASSAR